MTAATLQPRRDDASNAPAGTALTRNGSLTGYVTSIAMTAVATVVGIGLDSGIAIPNLSLVYVVPVIIAGVNFGLGASLCSAVLGAVAYNFFFTEPRYTLLVDDPANIWAIALLFLVGIIVSTVSYTARRRAMDVALLKRQVAVLQDYGRDIVSAGSADAINACTSDALSVLFRAPAIVVLVSGDKIVSFAASGGAEPEPAELEAAQSSLEMGAVARAGSFPTQSSRFDFWPVIGKGGLRAVIGIAFDPDNRPLSQDAMVDIIRGTLTLALDRTASH